MRHRHARLGTIAQRYLEAGQGQEFLVDARRALATETRRLAREAGLEVGVAAAGAGWSARTFRRVTQELRESEPAPPIEDAHAQAITALQGIQLERERAGVGMPLTRSDIDGVLRRFFPGSPTRRDFIVSTWTTRSWLEPVPRGFKVAPTTSTFRVEADAARLREAREQIDALTSAEAPKCWTLRLALDAPVREVALQARQAVLSVLTRVEQERSDPAGRPVEVGLVGAFGLDGEEPARMSLWAEARALHGVCPDFLAHYRTAPVSLPADLELRDSLVQAVREALAPLEAPPHVDARPVRLMVVSCLQ